MRSVSHKIRTGVLELHTDIGLAYASPSLWETHLLALDIPQFS